MVPLCQGRQVSTQLPEASLALALMNNSQGLPRLQDSCRQTKPSAKEYGSSKQNKGYYKENGNFNKVCKWRKASLCTESFLHAHICQEKNFLDLKELWNTVQGRQLPNHFYTFFTANAAEEVKQQKLGSLNSNFRNTLGNFQPAQEAAFHQHTYLCKAPWAAIGHAVKIEVSWTCHIRAESRYTSRKWKQWSCSSYYT